MRGPRWPEARIHGTPQCASSAKIANAPLAARSVARSKNRFAQLEPRAMPCPAYKAVTVTAAKPPVRLLHCAMHLFLQAAHWPFLIQRAIRRGAKGWLTHASLHDRGRYRRFHRRAFRLSPSRQQEDTALQLLLVVNAGQPAVTQRHSYNGPLPPRPPNNGLSEQEPEIILPAHAPASARRSDRPSLGSIPPRALLDEASAVALERQQSRRTRILWTVAGAIPATVLLWTHLKSRHPDQALLADVPLLPAMIGSVSTPGAARPAQGTQDPPTAATEPAPIDMDEDERPGPAASRGPLSAPRENTPLSTSKPANTSGSSVPVEERASDQSDSPAPSASSNIPLETNHPATKKRAWFPED
jgi:hypothetical protein